MGFGISDEVLEKILAEPFNTCVSSYLYPSKYTINNKKYACGKQESRVQTNIKPITATATVKPNRSNSNFELLSSVYKQLIELHSEIDEFWSDEYKSIIEQVYDYFKNIVELHSISTTPSPKDNAKAQSYLFDGFSECIFYYLTHNTLTKPKLRSIVEDTLRLVGKWGLFELRKEKASKQIFFDYYINRYGLSKNEFHCCPHCGSEIIQGIYNCPNCYAQTDILPTKHKALIDKPIIADIDTTVDAPNEEINELQAKLIESNTEIQKIRETNKDLLRENERLRSALKGKDVAIQAMSQFINGNETHDEIKKVLIIGDIPMNTQEVFELSTQVGITPDMIDIIDDFSKIKKLAGRIKNDDKYAGIIIGAVPHKVSKLGNASSLSTLFRGNGYPFLVEARTYQGELKITKESLKRAMTDMMFHLLSKGLL